MLLESREQSKRSDWRWVYQYFVIDSFISLLTLIFSSEFDGHSHSHTERGRLSMRADRDPHQVDSSLSQRNHSHTRVCRCEVRLILDWRDETGPIQIPRNAFSYVPNMGVRSRFVMKKIYRKEFLFSSMEYLRDGNCARIGSMGENLIVLWRTRIRRLVLSLDHYHISAAFNAPFGDDWRLQVLPWWCAASLRGEGMRRWTIPEQ